MLSGYEKYLGSRPELARKDSQTYSANQDRFSIYFYHHAHTHGSHKLQCRHIRSLLLDVRRVMSWFRSAVTSRTSEARQGWSGICGVSFPLARRVIQVLSLVACLQLHFAQTKGATYASLLLDLAIFSPPNMIIRR
jgi:hypothetical protein